MASTTHNETMDAVEKFTRSLYTRSRSTGRKGNRPWSKAIASEVLAVHPKDVKEAMEFDRKHGCSVNYDKHGRPIFADRNIRKRYMKAHGKFDRDAGYGDAQRGQSRLAGYEEPEADYSHLDSATGPPGVEVRKSGVRYFVGVK